MAFLAFLLLGCGASDCASRKGLERDTCYNAAIRASVSPVEVGEIASKVTDPIVRDAAVIRWVVEHRRDINQTDGEALCGLLSAHDEEAACLRRLSAAHLSR